MDVLSESGTLATQFLIPKSETEITIQDLTPGTYTAIVYGKQDEVYTKVAPPVIFEIRGPSSFSIAARIWFTILLAGLILTVGALILLARRRRAARTPKTPTRRTFLHE